MVFAVRSALVLGLVLSSLGAQHNGAAEPVIEILGASVSAGFVDPRPRPDGARNGTVNLAWLLERAVDREGLRWVQRASVASFLDPVRVGTRQVERALKDRPTLVIAVDFMFWFGYGNVARPGAEDEAKQRLALQSKGLALLARFDCPVLVGDYPDMRRADPRMLPPGAVPSVPVLVELNDGLRQWATARKNVHLFPLARLVTGMQGKGEPLELATGALHAPPETLLQGDRLHPTRLGMALLGHRLLAHLAAVLPEDHVLRTGRPTLDTLVKVAGAVGELEELAPVKGGGR